MTQATSVGAEESASSSILKSLFSMAGSHSTPRLSGANISLSSSILSAILAKSNIAQAARESGSKPSISWTGTGMKPAGVPSSVPSSSSGRGIAGSLGAKMTQDSKGSFITAGGSVAVGNSKVAMGDGTVASTNNMVVPGESKVAMGTGGVKVAVGDGKVAIGSGEREAASRSPAMSSSDSVSVTTATSGNLDPATAGKKELPEVGCLAGVLG